MAYYTPARERPTFSSTSRPTTSSTGYDILPDYGVFDIFKNPDIPRALKDYKRHLEKHCL
jgi:hypothetical protein